MPPSVRQTGGKLAIALALAFAKLRLAQSASSKYSQLLLAIAKTGMGGVIETDKGTATT